MRETVDSILAELRVRALHIEQLGAQNYTCSMRITVMSLNAQANATWNSENKSYELGSSRVVKDKVLLSSIANLDNKIIRLSSGIQAIIFPSKVITLLGSLIQEFC